MIHPDLLPANAGASHDLIVFLINGSGAGAAALILFLAATLFMITSERRKP